MTSFESIQGYRRAVVKTTQRTGGTIRRPDLPARYVAHVTVGIRLYDYPYPPHFTVAWAGGHGLKPGRFDLRAWYTDIEGDPIVTLADGDVLRLQHCDVLKSAYALEGPGPRPKAACETNHAGHCLQCEFTLPAINDPAYLYRWEYRIIARETANQIHGLREATGNPTAVDPTKIRDWKGSAAWGYDDPWQMTCAEWQAYDGIGGHVDVPGQSHWDPGNWRHRLISRRVTRRLKRLTVKRPVLLEAK
jgi:hypothetical protein